MQAVLPSSTHVHLKLYVRECFFSNRFKIRMTRNDSDHKWPLFQTITWALKMAIFSKYGYYGLLLFLSSFVFLR